MDLRNVPGPQLLAQILKALEDRHSLLGRPVLGSTGQTDAAQDCPSPRL